MTEVIESTIPVKKPRGAKVKTDTPVSSLSAQLTALRKEQERIQAIAGDEAAKLVKAAESVLKELNELIFATNIEVDFGKLRSLVKEGTPSHTSLEKMTFQEANAAISELLTEAQNTIRAAEEVANKFHLEFELDVGCYGMGGTYSGTDGEWNSSSQSC